MDSGVLYKNKDFHPHAEKLYVCYISNCFAFDLFVCFCTQEVFALTCWFWISKI